MFESAEVRQRISARVFKEEEAELRVRLLDAQYRLLETKSKAVLILVAGMDAAGKGESVNLLNAWLDPRHISTRSFEQPSAQDRELPPLARYWRLLPPRGRIGIFFGSWYTELLEGSAEGRLD